MGERISRILLVFLTALTLTACTPETYDLVIENGRVIDPETGVDEVLNLGINGGTIVSIDTKTLEGINTIDATGLVVAPGFIDIHSHSPTPLGTSYQALDGVTTQLDLEAGAWPVQAYGSMIRGTSRINYGSSVSHLSARIKAIEGKDMPYLITEDSALVPGAAFVQIATKAQITEISGYLNDGLDNGGLGIGVLLDYMSIAVSDAELDMIFDVASARNAPVTVHVRRGMAGDPAGLQEIIARAETYDVPVLICHITHSAMQAVPDWLAKIDAANARGAKIATETLTWAAGGTSIGAAVFHRDWQTIFNITYADVQWTATGEWLSEESFNHYQKTQPAGMVNHHYVKEDWMEASLSWPKMMASSDVTPAVSEDILANPNLSGTFSRFIGHYARDRKVVTLSEALAKSSLYQAQWLEGYAPAFKGKGRIQTGMDADIVVFDYTTIAPRADYGDPYKASNGISAVIVAGELVAKDGVLVADLAPGKSIKATIY